MDGLPELPADAIVVGVDDSDDARRALHWAVREAGAHGVPLYVLSVWQYPLTGAPRTAPDADPIDPDAFTRERLVEYLHTEIGPDWNDRAEPLVAYGFPARVMTAISEQVALVVVGPRGRSGFAALTLGSTADHLVRHAACPVVIVR